LSYTLGFYAIWSHKAGYYNWFNNILLMTVFSKIVISYLNVLNLLVFIMKIVTYLYARFVLSVLHTVLVIPQPAQRNNNNNENAQQQEPAQEERGPDD
jgi:hypothetical protein